MCHGPCFLMEPMNPVLSCEGRWLTGDVSARASGETGVPMDPVQVRLDELLRRLESQEFFDLDSSSNTDHSERRAARN